MKRNELQEAVGLIGATMAHQIYLVLLGLRPAARIKSSRRLIAEIVKLTKRLGLFVAVGFDSVKHSDTYSEWTSKVPTRATANSPVYLYIASSIKASENLRRCDESCQDDEVGDLLGYPSCCIDGFTQAVFPICADDPVLQRYSELVSIDWRLNVSLLRYDVALLCHVPCSPLCASSLALATLFADAFRAYDPEYLEQLEDVLSTCVLHSERMGVVACTAERDGANYIVREVIRCVPGTPLAQLVLPGCRLQAIETQLYINSRPLEDVACLFDFQSTI